MYGISALPTAQFGGYLQDVGGGSNIYTRYLSKYNQIVSQNSPLEISQTSTTIGDNLVVTADISVTSTITSTNNKVIFIITRYQNSDYFSSVVYYSDASFNLTTVGESQSFEETIPIQSGWNIEDLQTVVIVQSWQDDHVLQASRESISLGNMFSINAEFTELIFDDDQDGVINPGEDITLLLSVVNESINIEADNIIGEFSIENPNITIDQIEYTFGPLGNNGATITEQISLSIDENISLGDFPINLTLSTSYTDIYGNPGEFSYTFPLQINVSMFQAGWPFTIEDQVTSSPAVFDINQNGSNEVIFGDYSGLLHVLDAQRRELPGFPFDLGNDIWGSPAVADLEQDGDFEIIVGSKNKHLFIINADGSVQADYDSQQYIMGTPAIGNIDDDPELEVVFSGYSSPGKLFAIDPDGTPVNGFPFELGHKVQRGVALADFNGNGKDDIVCGTDSESIVLIYDDLTIAEGFPFQADNDFRCAPSVLDLVGEKIIFCGSRDDNLYAVNADGTLRFSIQTGGDVASSPGFVNTNNGYGVFFGSDDGYLYGVDINGDALPGWPVNLGDDVEVSPAFADLDGDGVPEVVAGTTSGLVYALNMDGSVFQHFPIQYSFPIKGNPTIEDFDQDGDLEIFIGSTWDLLAIDIDIKDSGSNENTWNLHRGNLQRSGLLTVNSVSTVPEENIMIPKDYELKPAYPNPFNPVTTISFVVPDHSVGESSLQIINLTGHIVEVLLEGNIQPGNHSIRWNAAGHSSGVYFARLVTKDYISTQKLVLLK